MTHEQIEHQLGPLISTPRNCLHSFMQPWFIFYPAL